MRWGSEARETQHPRTRGKKAFLPSPLAQALSLVNVGAFSIPLWFSIGRLDARPAGELRVAAFVERVYGECGQGLTGNRLS